MELDSASIGMIVALIVLVTMSAYFSATETAFTSLNRIRLRTKADAGDRRAARTLAVAEDYDKLLSTILIGNNSLSYSSASSRVLAARMLPASALVRRRMRLREVNAVSVAEK